MPRPNDNEYYIDDRTTHVAQGDIFRGVPFSSASGDTGLGFSGFGMLVHYTSNMMNGSPGTQGYAHDFRLVAPILSFPMLQELGLSDEHLVNMRNGDRMGRYLYLPTYPD